MAQVVDARARGTGELLKYGFDSSTDERFLFFAISSVLLLLLLFFNLNDHLIKLALSTLLKLTVKSTFEVSEPKSKDFPYLRGTRELGERRKLDNVKKKLPRLCSKD